MNLVQCIISRHFMCVKKFHVVFAPPLALDPGNTTVFCALQFLGHISIMALVVTKTQVRGHFVRKISYDHTDTRSVPIALPGPLKWCLKSTSTVWIAVK